MACDKNINELLNIDFSTENDQFNWLSNTTTPINTVNGQLRLLGQSSTSRFTRSLGFLDPANNRIRFQSNMDVYRPPGSSDETFCAKFEIFNGSSLIDVFTLYLDELASGQTLEYNFDRIYKYEGLSGAVSVKITTIEGWNNQMFLDYVKSYDFNYCEDDVRNYFVLKDFFDDSIGSVSSGIQLLEWKVGGVETLTSEFFNENTTGANPVSDWELAKANIDGSSRVSEISDPNSFNPFISEFGLDYDPANYFDGKPIGTLTGSDYGSGILQLGFEKPSVLNENLNVQNGAFFIDIDYTQNLKVVFSTLIKNTSGSIFDSPDVYRKYFIIWNSKTCTGEFYYLDVLNNELKTDEIVNGFLSGVTGTESSIETIGCDESFSFSGSAGTFEFQIDFGSEIGLAGIDYNAWNAPDKFEIEWNGVVYSSGYVGSSGFDQQLLNLGISPSEIKTGSPSTGLGSLMFNKTDPSPSTAIVRVTAPLAGTAWNIAGICPDGGVPNQPPTVDISSSATVFNKDDEQTFDIVASDPDGTIESWNVVWGDGGTTSGSGTPPATLNHTFTTLGNKNITITVTDDDGAIGTDTITVDIVGSTSYQITGTRTVNCGDTSGMSGTLIVNSGQVLIENEKETLTGQYFGVAISIDGTSIASGNVHVVGVGTYPFTSNLPNCTQGTGLNTMMVYPN